MSAVKIFEGTDYDDELQAQALLQASRMLNPYVSTTPDTDEEMRPLVDRVLDRVREETGLESFDDVSDKIRARDIITEWMSNVVLEGADQEELDRRLAQLGLLERRHYNIEVSDDLKEKGPSFGIQPSHVEQAIRHADLVSHYDPLEESESPVSLFVEHHKESREPFSLLVTARREGQTIVARDAHRIYHEDVRAGTYIRDPYEFLHAFAEKYGVPLTIGNKTKTFFWLEKIDKPSKFNVYRETEITVFKTTVPANSTVSLRSIIKDTRDEIHVCLAYALHVDKYKEDLRKHDVTFYNG